MKEERQLDLQRWEGVMAVATDSAMPARRAGDRVNRAAFDTERADLEDVVPGLARRAEQRLDETRRRIADLKRIEGVLAHLLHDCESHARAPRCPIIAAIEGADPPPR